MGEFPPFRTRENHLWEALRRALLEAFVASLPDGLHVQVGQDGASLSCGQARRRSAARALLTDAPIPILILGEPTEGLDLKPRSDYGVRCAR